MDTQVAKARLEELKERLTASAAQIAGAGDAEDVNSSEQHSEESGTDVADNDREEASAEIVANQLGRVNDALDRIAAGSYGRCVDCGRQIPDARLEAMPEAERDVEDQEKYEASLAG